MHGSRSSARLVGTNSTHTTRPDVSRVIFMADGAQAISVAALAVAAAAAAAAAVTRAGEDIAIAAGR